MWDHFFQLLFPKDSKSQKILDNRKWGQKDVQTVPQKWTHNQSDKQTHGRTFRLIESIGPEGRCFEKDQEYVFFFNVFQYFKGMGRIFAATLVLATLTWWRNAQYWWK